MNDIKARFVLKMQSDGWSNIAKGTIQTHIFDLKYVSQAPIHHTWEIIACDLWTGHKDKNEKFIFNGDTVKHKFRRIWKTDAHVSKVEWDQNWACFYLKDGNGTKHRMRDDIEYEIVKTPEYA